MTKRALPPQPIPTRQIVKLITCRDGELMHYVEPSVVCAAQHAIHVCDNEEGCAQAIDVGGQVVWEFDPERARQSVSQLDELAAQGECTS